MGSKYLEISNKPSIEGDLTWFFSEDFQWNYHPPPFEGAECLKLCKMIKLLAFEAKISSETRPPPIHGCWKFENVQNLWWIYFVFESKCPITAQIWHCKFWLETTSVSIYYVIHKIWDMRPPRLIECVIHIIRNLTQKSSKTPLDLQKFWDKELRHPLKK